MIEEINRRGKKSYRHTTRYEEEVFSRIQILSKRNHVPFNQMVNHLLSERLGVTMMWNMNYPRIKKEFFYLWIDDVDMNRGNRNIWDRHPSVLFHQYFYRIRGHKNVSNHHFWTSCSVPFASSMKVMVSFLLIKLIEISFSSV